MQPIHNTLNSHAQMRHIKTTLAMLAAALTTAASAQDKVEGTLATDIVSQYIWRGTDCGNAAIQPTLGIAWKGFSLNAWGSVGLTSASDTRELDLTVGYSVKGFNIGVTDYWFSSGNEPGGRYFLYKNSKTNHVFEGNIGYDFGPVAVQWYTNFAGGDGLNSDGKRAYSSYVELSAPFDFVKCHWTATVGAVPYATSYYGTGGFAVTNVSLKACKSFCVRDKVDIPVYTALTANPRTQHMYLTVGFAISPRL